MLKERKVDTARDPSTRIIRDKEGRESSRKEQNRSFGDNL
jgi:hypothetical protein